MRQQSLSLRRSHVARMPAAMKFDTPSHAVQVGLFRWERQMTSANSFARDLSPDLRLGSGLSCRGSVRR